jgi:hypothetical protein
MEGARNHLGATASLHSASCLRACSSGLQPHYFPRLNCCWFRALSILQGAMSLANLSRTATTCCCLRLSAPFRSHSAWHTPSVCCMRRVISAWALSKAVEGMYQPSVQFAVRCVSSRIDVASQQYVKWNISHPSYLAQLFAWCCRSAMAAHWRRSITASLYGRSSVPSHAEVSAKIFRISRRHGAMRTFNRDVLCTSRAGTSAHEASFLI